MRVLEAEFMLSSADPSGADWPAVGPPEVAVIGRSNVGKSTLLGTLLQRPGLVRVSKTPGRTRLLNFFRLLATTESGRKLELRFADLPGFGYAHVSKAERATFRPLIQAYLGTRPTLSACLLLVDARRGAEVDETELSRWLLEQGRQVLPVMTKSDKLSKHERRPAADRIRQALGRPPVLVSGTRGEGIADLWARLLRSLSAPASKL